MCGTCGCGDDSVRITKPGEKHHHEHNHSHSHEDGHTHDHFHEHQHHHEHSHDEHSHNHPHEHETDHNHSHSHGEHSHTHEINLERNVLDKNNRLAERNRGFFEAKNIFAINLVSSPGSGKTSLLERTIKDLGKEIKLFVIEGDQQTLNDAERIQKAGAPAIQINTGNGCHLDADMISRASKELNISDNSLLIIENVGNLVCPSMFDLGESKRVVVISTTEGDDKPLKYPYMFQSSDVCIINKTDLLPYVDFSVAKAKENAMRVNHHLEFFEVSVKTGDGMENWYEWLKKNIK